MSSDWFYARCNDIHERVTSLELGVVCGMQVDVLFGNTRDVMHSQQRNDINH